MQTPIKAIKVEAPIIAQREKAGRELFFTAVSKVRQPIESLFNLLNEKTNIQRAMKVRSTTGLLLHTIGKIAIAFIYIVSKTKNQSSTADSLCLHISSLKVLFCNYKELINNNNSLFQ